MIYYPLENVLSKSRSLLNFVISSDKTSRGFGNKFSKTILFLLYFSSPIMSTNDGPPSLTEKQLDNIQGDIWSKGFPKYYETYYFFAIKPGNAKFFAQSLKDLVTQSPPLISTLRSVKKDRARIQEWKDQAGAQAKTLGTQAKYDSLLPISNALIAFTRKGLDAVRSQ